jgi:uncharacterized cupredoxin-like copper-binding protein
MSARKVPSIRSIAAVAFVVTVLGACGASAGAPSFTYAPASGSTTSAAPAAAPAAAATIDPTANAVLALAFTPGTKTSPRMVDLTADDQLTFTPGFVQVAVGETVTFRIHNAGKAVHEFMVGPLAAAFADKKGTPEMADIAGGKSADLTYTFTGKGPFGFACHATGHFEHGMAGYIQLVGPGAPTVGTKENPRLIHLDMTDSLTFTPEQVPAAPGEAIRFVLTNSGTVEHEFQVGPADKVAADEHDGVIVVEKDKLTAGTTTAVDYTFTGSGPFAFACHMPAHYEAGMKGTIDTSGS